MVECLVQLPDTVWLKILSYLDHQDLVSVIHLEKEVHWFASQIAKDKSLWKFVIWKASNLKFNFKLIDINRNLWHVQFQKSTIYDLLFHWNDSK